MDPFNIFYQRKSVRKFTEENVSRETLTQLIRAAMAAPTAGNKQPWAFVAVDAPEVLARLGAVLPYAGFVKGAPAAIVVCGDLSKAFDGVEEPFWVQDCSAATQNILLACEMKGLGAVWTGVYPLQERMDAVSDILNLPDHIVPLNVIPLGTPSGTPKPKEKWAPENLHWQAW
ncbi:nitroreductase family protein [Desulfoluna spongiiphila]|uniref:nitroreductase family protein n=1 Tax=Desulfoluna spongiiphila TaxID=419481 RepID=UPI001251431A|nr:nitroreductase family protein [Desulfoluna spongiiphila]VVS92553.1 nitroreductase [Desulfoluna spongiiphila]